MIFMNPLHHPYFVKFIVYFNENQDFFECHEVLEDYWKSIPHRTKEHPLATYILLATSLYHWRRGNTVGALRSLEKAFVRFKTMVATYPNFTQDINFDQLVHDIEHSISLIKDEQPFSSFSLEINSSALNLKVLEMTKSLELLPFGSDAVIHKHMLRYRSDIHKQ